jgi:hypothetical protein
VIKGQNELLKEFYEIFVDNEIIMKPFIEVDQDLASCDNNQL